MTNATPDITNSLAGTEDIELGKDILGIRGPVEIPNGWEWLLYVLGALVLILLAALLIKRLLRRATIIKPPPIPYVAPHALARRQLEAALRVIEDPYRFCSAVSDAVRGYIEGRFAIHAPDRTTDEFLDELRVSTALNVDQQNSISDFLTECDLVKFARNEPDRQSLEQLHKSALVLIEETTLETTAIQAVPNGKEVERA